MPVGKGKMRLQSVADSETYEKIEKLAITESRSHSQMVLVLVKEALMTREKEKKNK